jgi:hypothetical protein
MSVTIDTIAVFDAFKEYFYNICLNISHTLKLEDYIATLFCKM